MTGDEPHAEFVVYRVAPGVAPAVIEALTAALGGETADAVITIEPAGASDIDGGREPLLRITARSAHPGKPLAIPDGLRAEVERVGAAEGGGVAC